MEKTDARELRPQAQQQLRHQAIRLHKRGFTHRQIAEIIGAHPTRICRWCRAYETGGAKAVSIRKRGRRPGSGRRLNAEQEKQLRQMIRDKTPDQLKLAFALWTRLAVQQVIRQQWGLRMPIRTVGEYLRRCVFTPQKPIRRADEQNPQAVRRWLVNQDPAIARRAKHEKAKIHGGDETGLRNGYRYGRSYALRGQTPAVRMGVRKERIGLISTVTHQGQMRFMVYRHTMNAAVMKKFLQRLVKDAERKVFLIVGNRKVHHSKPVKEWLASHPDQIEVFYLPADCPELNPEEYLNNDLKSGVCGAEAARTRTRLTEKAVSHLRSLQKQPQRVQRLAHHPQASRAQRAERVGWMRWLYRLY